MLILDLQRVFDLRGITRPTKFLIDHGFAEATASRLTNNVVFNFNMKFLEKLCIILKCTPNDLLLWIPEKGVVFSEDLPLNELIKKKDDSEFSNLRSNLPLGKLEKMMNSLTETGTDKKDRQTIS